MMCNSCEAEILKTVENVSDKTFENNVFYEAKLECTMLPDHLSIYQIFKDRSYNEIQIDNKCALARSDMDELKDGIGDTVVTLIILAQQNGLTLEECLACAYEEIADRKGEMVNGVFVKESDLNKKV